MNDRTTWFFALMFLPLFSMAGNTLRTLDNQAFQRGEMLKYRLHYGFIDAGIAQITITNEDKKIAGHDTYHAVGIGYSTGAFDWFFKVRDRYETYIDQQAIVPWIFIRRVNEGGYIIKQNYVFDHMQDSVSCGKGKVFAVPPNVQDMLSAFYYARCIDFSQADSGTVYTIKSFVDQKIYALKIQYMGKDTINTDLGKFACIKFRPVVQTGRIFKNNDDLQVWISDDNNHIPIRAEAKIWVGAIRMDLVDYSGLKNPVSLLSK